MTKKIFLAFRVTPDLKEKIEEIANIEQRSVSQICDLFLRGGVEAYRRERGHYVQALLKQAKPKKPETH